MKKRILSCLMALALCLTLLPAAALAEGKETEVTTADALATALNGDAAIIKLTANIEISAMLTVNRTVTLDLNDHVLKMTGTGTGRVIEVKNGVNLTLVDNAETKTEKYFNNNIYNIYLFLLLFLFVLIVLLCFQLQLLYLHLLNLQLKINLIF